jgi:CRISPR-associated protein Cas2
MSDKRWHLITYDVREPKRLRQVAQTLEGFGERVQYSVFRCRLSDTSLEQLRWELTKIMEEEDSLLVIPLCPRCAGRIPKHSTGDQSKWAEPPTSFDIL